VTESAERFARVLPELPEIRILRLQPGDVIALFMEKNIAEADFRILSERMRAKFPDNEIALFEGGMTIGILRKEGE
jgi:hypothetical protein